ncbi:unnamed protein product [Urochloa decumbens]|uniref:Uncharacterized protein n=1 Tax=Urochloa decumbens TaxID=240449 RepID=A0ABC8X649_9POAL
MGRMSCFAGMLSGKNKASKGKNKRAYAKMVNGNDCPKVKPVEFLDMADTVDVTTRGGDVLPACNTSSKFVAHAAAGLARRESVESGDKAAIKKPCSPGADLVAVAAGNSDSSSDDGTSGSAKSAEPDAGESSSTAGRVSSPGPAPAASPRLQRSCSNIETTRSSAPPRAFDDLPAKSRSYNDLNAVRSLANAWPDTPSGGAPDASPAASSVRSSCSADQVMLKKRSSMQVLPSRSRKLWWQLFMWSHRNLHRAGAGAVTAAPPSAAAAPHQQHDGYSSDILDTVTVATAEASSPLDRVSAWVNSLGDGSFFHAADEDDATEHGGGGAARPQCSEIEEVPVAVTGKRRHSPQAKRRAADEAAANNLQASSIVHTLNVFSSVAHISGMGLKAVPAIAGFSTLRAVNLSGNLIVQIAPGSLPKGLHSLDLSRNKIAAIEGLRELTRLRVLNLSYNRISRIGHGLSGCTAIRELYLAGNKISDVEGLHRLLKLAVLDVSYNRVTTAKSLGQLVANYGSLRALNLVGNPVQAAAGDDALRRAVSGLLPRIEYLNRQAVKPQRAREVAKDSVAQAALGNGAAGGWSSRRRTARRVAQQSPGTPSKGRAARDGGSSRRGSRSRSKTRAQGTTSLSISRR